MHDKQAHLFPELSVGSHPSVHSSSDRSTREVRDLLQRRGWAFLKISGKSMFPWIRPRDLVLLRRASVAAISRGDVIVFAKNVTLCMHRVLLLTRASTEDAQPVLITKGDAVADRDDPVLATEVLGKVEFVYRRNREIRISTGWRRYLGKLLALASPSTKWWKPAASRLSHVVARCELFPVSPVETQRSSEHSAD